jgi:hypothetical protein
MAEVNPLVAIGDTYTMKLPRGPGAVYVAFCILALAGAAGLVMQFECSPDDGVTWLAAGTTPIGGGAVVTSAGAVGIWTFLAIGCTHVRMRISALTSGGPITARINETDV